MKRIKGWLYNILSKRRMDRYEKMLDGGYTITRSMYKNPKYPKVGSRAHKEMMGHIIRESEQRMLYENVPT